MPRIVEPTTAAIADAARRLRDGAVVAFPTETVYGLGADTYNAAALGEVYELKGRPADNPLIAHVLGATDARHLSKGWDDRCDTVTSKLWPGPLTIVVARDEQVPDRATAGLPTIAIRSPRHTVARALLEAFGGPISAPSANRSGHVSPTTARHVADDHPLAHDLVVLDGGPSVLGIESTVLDLTRETPRVLRPGCVGVRELETLLGTVEAPAVAAQDASPGTSQSHYAPHTPAELVEPGCLGDRLAELARHAETAAVLCFDRSVVSAPHHAVEMPQGAGDYGKTLYDALRRADALGVGRVIIEAPPASNEMWKAILDRLERATRG